MAKVPLRKYNSEIEALIEQGQTDEAIAHCRHILKFFPKHLETYRLLGKAYLESKRHSEASDIFNRILMSVPDDFVSHVGLSIVADDQKKLDDAIWHMERAFEKQPSNAAIQAELQRLYGKRDGREPPKIRLNRGALAHMYYQGELYMQAVGEIRSVLAEDPNRTDLQNLLALSYFRAGQKVEASETCSHLLGQYPYCLDANRALVEILPGTGMADDASIYRQRVVELDPYAAYARGSIFQTGDVPDDAITLERLEYKGKPVEATPDWSQSLGLGVGAAGAAATEQPDWLKAELEASPRDLRDEVEPLAAAAGQSMPDTLGPIQDNPEPVHSESEEIPEWMRKAGWGESTGTFDESAASISEETSEETPEGELARADLPDWIKSMAPKDSELAPATPEASITPESSALDQETLDWLDKLGGEQPFGSTPAVETPREESFAETLNAEGPADVPDWLASLDKPSGNLDSPVSAETPDWLSEMRDTSQEAPAGAAVSTADWLSKLDDEEAPVPVLKDEITSMTEPKEKLPPEPIPPVQPVLDAGIGNLGTSAAEQDAALLWLESLAAKQGAKSEELISKPEDRLEKPPEWVEQAVEQNRDVSQTQPVSQISETQPVSLVPDVEPVSQMPEPEPVNQLPEPVEHKAEPDWGAADLTEAASSEMPEIDRTGIWLSELDEKEAKSEKTYDVDSTAWSGEIEITTPSATPLAESAHEEEVPAWLQDTDGKPITPVAGSLGDMPEWLRREEREESAAPEPTQPADWLPEAEITAPPAVPEPPKPAVRKPEPKPKPKAELKFEQPPEPKVELKVEQPPEPKVELKFEQPPEPKPQPKPQPKVQVKLEPKPQVKPLSKPEAAAKEDITKIRRNGMLPSMIDPTLASARDTMSRGKIPDALQVYGNLIRKGKLLEDITFDLKEALYRFPVEVSIWQTLGDAYMRSNRLQDALDAYTKAEELLR